MPPAGKGKIKEPTVFDGTREKTDAFLDQLFLLFVGRPQDFTADYNRIATALSYMEGKNVEYWKTGYIMRAREIDPTTGQA